VQRAIAAALGSIGAETKTTKVVAPIEAALVDLVARGDGLTRESAVVALGQIVPGTDSGTAKLREVLLVDPDTRVKTAAYEALQVRSPHSAGM
jgi:HEAT repeat protein